MSEHDEVVVEVVVAAPADTVWRALRDPAEVRRWFGWEYPGLEEEIRGMFLDGADSSEAERVLRIGAGSSDRLAVEAQGAGVSVVRVIRSAPAPAGSAGWNDVYDDEIEGWISFLQQLRFAIERHPGADRRTLYLAGRATDRTAVPVTALGLGGLEDVGAGAPYGVRTDPGDRLTGRVWFRSAHQLGLTVDAWGDGLLVVTRRPARDDAPQGGGQALLTGYGPAREWGGLADRWSAWWRERYVRVTVAP